MSKKKDASFLKIKIKNCTNTAFFAEFVSGKIVKKNDFSPVIFIHVFSEKPESRGYLIKEICARETVDFELTECRECALSMHEITLNVAKQQDGDSLTLLILSVSTGETN